MDNYLFKFKSESFKAGYAAFKASIPQNGNPCDGLAYFDWNSGWETANHENELSKRNSTKNK